MIKKFAAYLCLFLALFRCLGLNSAHAGRRVDVVALSQSEVFEYPKPTKSMGVSEFEVVLDANLLSKPGTYALLDGSMRVGVLTFEEGKFSLQGDGSFDLHFSHNWSGAFDFKTTGKIGLKTAPKVLVTPSGVISHTSVVNHGLIKTLDDVLFKYLGEEPDATFRNCGALTSDKKLHFIDFKHVELSDDGHVVTKDLVIETTLGNPLSREPVENNDYGSVILGGDIRFVGAEESTLWISSGGVQLKTDLVVPHLYSFLPKNPLGKKHVFTNYKQIQTQTALIQGLENEGQFIVHDSFGLVKAPERFAELYDTYGFAWDNPLEASVTKNTGVFRARKAFKLDELATEMKNIGQLILGDESKDQTESFHNLKLKGSGSVVIGSNFRKPHLTFVGSMGEVRSITPSHTTITLVDFKTSPAPISLGGSLDIYLERSSEEDVPLVWSSPLNSGGDVTLHNYIKGSLTRVLFNSNVQSTQTTRLLSKGDVATSNTGFIQAGGAILIGDKKRKATLVHDGSMKSGRFVELAMHEVSGKGTIHSPSGILVSGKEIDLSKMRLESQNLLLKATDKLSLPETDLHVEGLVSASGEEVDVPSSIKAKAIQIEGKSHVKGPLVATEAIVLKGKATVEGTSVKAPMIESFGGLDVKNSWLEGGDISLYGSTSLTHSSIYGSVTASGPYLSLDHSRVSGEFSHLRPGTLVVNHSTLDPKSLFVSTSNADISNSTVSPEYGFDLSVGTLKARHNTFSGPVALFDIQRKGTLSNNTFRSSKTELKGGMVYSTSDTFTGDSLYAHPSRFSATDSVFGSDQTAISSDSTYLNNNLFTGASLGIDSNTLYAYGNSFSVPAAHFKAKDFYGSQNWHQGQDHSFLFTGLGGVLGAIHYVDQLYGVSQVSLSMPNAHFEVPDHIGFNHSGISLRFGTIKAEDSLITGNQYTLASYGYFYGFNTQVYGGSGVRLGSEQGHFFAPALKSHTHTGVLEIFGNQGVTLDGYVSGYNSTSSTRKSGPFWRRRKVTTWTDTPIFERAHLEGDQVIISSSNGPVSLKGSHIKSRNKQAILASPVHVDLDALTAMEHRYQKKSLYWGGRMSRTYSGDMKSRQTSVFAPEIVLDTPEVIGRSPILNAPLIQNHPGTFDSIDSEAYCHRVSYGPLKPTKENIATLVAIATTIWIAPQITPQVSSNALIQGAINAGVKAATAKAAHDLVVHNGNPFMAAKSFSDPKSLRRMALSTVTGGLTAGTLQAMDIHPLSFDGHLVTNTINAFGESAFFDTDIRANLRRGLYNAVIDTETQYLAYRLGGLYEREALGYWSHKGLHFALGAGTQYLKGGDGAQIIAGGTGAMVGEMAAEYLLEEKIFNIETAGNIAKFSGALAGYFSPHLALEGASRSVDWNTLKHIPNTHENETEEEKRKRLCGERDCIVAGEKTVIFLDDEGERQYKNQKQPPWYKTLFGPTIFGDYYNPYPPDPTLLYDIRGTSDSSKGRWSEPSKLPVLYDYIYEGSAGVGRGVRNLFVGGLEILTSPYENFIKPTAILGYDAVVLTLDCELSESLLSRSLKGAFGINPQCLHSSWAEQSWNRFYGVQNYLASKAIEFDNSTNPQKFGLVLETGTSLFGGVKSLSRLKKIIPREIPIGFKSRLPIRMRTSIEKWGDIHTYRLLSRKGDEIFVEAYQRIDGKKLILSDVSVDGIGPGSSSVLELRRFIKEVGRRQNVDQVVIHGGTRVTGAAPGHTPRPILIKVDK